MNCIKPIYKLFIPGKTAGFAGQWGDCLGQFLDFLSGGKFVPFRMNIFISSEGNRDYELKYKLIASSLDSVLDKLCAPFVILPQAPEHPYMVIVEAGFYPSGDVEVKYEKFNDRCYCEVQQRDFKEYWFIGMCSEGKKLDILESANSAFSILMDFFNHCGITMNHIVRQWNYIGYILSHSSINEHTMQHYQVFNEARYDYYSKYRNVAGYPAATGVGMDMKGVSLDCLALSGSKDLKVISISNPNQRNSYLYGQDVLVGEPLIQKHPDKHPPQFERAILISSAEQSRLFISGTASIIDQENVGKGDVIKQTEITIENIELLSSEDNLKRHLPELVRIPYKYSYIRVYVKNRADIPKIKSICLSHFGNAPVTFVKADICRDDLLVEIEAEMTDQ